MTTQAESLRAYFREHGWTIVMDDREGQPLDPFMELAALAATPPAEGLDVRLSDCEDALSTVEAAYEALAATPPAEDQMHGYVACPHGGCDLPANHAAPPAEGLDVERELRLERAAHGRTIRERDHAIEMADQLADALGGPNIGEHSNINDPWQNALDNPLRVPRLHPDDGYSYEECDGPSCRALRAPPAEGLDVSHAWSDCSVCGAAVDDPEAFARRATPPAEGLDEHTCPQCRRVAARKARHASR